MDKHYSFTVNLEEVEEGGYVATVPALPGCHTQGETYEETLSNVEEAIQTFVESLQKLGRPVPVEKSQPRQLHLNVKLSAVA